MRSSIKLSILSATLLAATFVVSTASADDTTAPVTTGAGASTVSSSTVTSPSTPSVPTTTTTITTQGTGVTPAPIMPSTPTSTTTTTSADDVTSSAPSAPLSSTSPDPRESTTIYNNRRPNLPIMITGGALLIGTYATTAGVVGANGSVGDHDLYIPLVGPWINLASRTCNGSCPNETRDGILIAGSGVLQGAGAALLLTSFFIPEKVAAAKISAGPVNMYVTPTVGGLGTVGTF